MSGGGSFTLNSAHVLITQGRVPDESHGSVTEMPPERCPNGHELRYPERHRRVVAEARERKADAGLALPDLQGDDLRRLIYMASNVYDAGARLSAIADTAAAMPT